jgi:hypothetical protein
MFDGRVYVNTQVCCYLGVGLGGLDAVCEIVVDFFGILQVGIAAGTDNQGRETAEFVGSLIGGFFGVLGGGGWGSAILGAIGSKYGGDIAEEIYDYFTNSVQAAQANPQSIYTASYFNNIIVFY